jgi:purine-binding chemotaxis protein CheW
VIFSLGKEWFAIEVSKVREVVDYPSNVAELPKTPDYVEGVFLLRKEELLLYSLKRFVGVDSEKQEKRVIVLELGNRKVGVAVDDVREIRWVSKESILPVEGVSSKGVIALDEGSRLVLILDPQEIAGAVASEELPDKNTANEEVEVKPMRNFVRFSIDNIDMAIPIEKVKEVVEVGSITSLPNSPEYVDGLFNLRNSVIVILSLCKRLGLSCSENSDRVIVLEDYPVGLRVANLKGIFKTEEENIQPAEGVSEPEEEFLEGIIKTRDGGIIFVISPDRIIKDEDVSLLDSGVEVEG